MRSLIWLHENIRQHDNATWQRAFASSQPVALAVFTPPTWLLDGTPRTVIARQKALQALAPDLEIIAFSDSGQLLTACQNRDIEMIFSDHCTDWAASQIQQQLAANITVKILQHNHLYDDWQGIDQRLAGRFTKFYYQTRQRFLAGLHLPSVDGPVDNFPLTEMSALAWAQRFLNGPIEHYKQTRNCLQGRGNFSQLSTALTIGSLSVQQLASSVVSKTGESRQTFVYELIWREYFHWLASCLGKRLFPTPAPLTDEQSTALQRWQTGQTPFPIVNAGIQELVQTGFLSNRIRQLVASVLVHEMAVPWQYGAAFFEQQLWDYHPGSNYGNWAYIAGYPPVSKRPHQFDIDWQTKHYDPDASYRRLYGQ